MTVNEKGSNVERRERRQARSVLFTLLLSVLVVAALAAAAPWLRASFGAPIMYVVCVTVVIAMLGYLAFFEFRQSRELDEVLRASQQFAMRWGASAGQFAFIVLMFVPPFQQFATAIVNRLASNAPTSADHGAIILVAMFLGFALLMVLQALGTLVFGIIWWKRSQQ
jgi:hypothetical protein